MAETQAYGCSSESAQQEVSNEYQYDRVKMVRTKVALALEGLKGIRCGLVVMMPGSQV